MQISARNQTCTRPQKGKTMFATRVARARTVAVTPAVRRLSNFHALGSHVRVAASHSSFFPCARRELLPWRRVFAYRFVDASRESPPGFGARARTCTFVFVAAHSIRGRTDERRSRLNSLLAREKTPRDPIRETSFHIDAERARVVCLLPLCHRRGSVNHFVLLPTPVARSRFRFSAICSCHPLCAGSDLRFVGVCVGGVHSTPLPP